MMKAKLAVVGVAVSGMLVACGDTPHKTSATSAEKTTKVELQWDGSGFSRYGDLYREEVTALLQKMARNKDEVLTAVLDGQPLTTADVKTTNFAQPLQEDGVEPSEEEEIKRAMAVGLAKTLTTPTKEVVVGSGQLQGLELAAKTPGVTTIYQWTDGIVNEPDNHFDLTSASSNEISREIHYWHDRLKGLAGKTVVMVGVGHGVGQISTVDRAHQLFTALVEGNGAHLVWSSTLDERQ